MRQKITPQTNVAIVGKDPIIGQALEALLKTAGYGTRFVDYSVTKHSRNKCADAHIVLLMPEFSKTSRKGFLVSEVSTAVTTDVPILELVSEPNEALSLRGRQVRWPCRLEQLRQEIEATRLGSASPYYS
jgi:5,10-methylene-tetrahydrofolate dehydrogenase/methenyl tetrahydrofolate cyclohydrolase